MKKFITVLTVAAISLQAGAQKVRSIDEISEQNSWLKVGINTAVPVGDLSNYSGFALGAELTGQFMRTDNFGLGLTTGYTNYFLKDIPENVNRKDIGAIPLGAMFRYYPQPQGIFAGTDAGYTFLTNVEGESGGFYIRPQVGYHNYNWNIFGFYNQVFRPTPSIDFQTLGLGVTYNLRFK